MSDRLARTGRDWTGNGDEAAATHGVTAVERDRIGEDGRARPTAQRPRQGGHDRLGAGHRHRRRRRRLDATDWPMADPRHGRLVHDHFRSVITELIARRAFRRRRWRWAGRRALAEIEPTDSMPAIGVGDVRCACVIRHEGVIARRTLVLGQPMRAGIGIAIESSTRCRCRCRSDRRRLRQERAHRGRRGWSDQRRRSSTSE